MSQFAKEATLSPGKWCAITCVLLAISGSVRLLRDQQFYSITKESKESPFPLSDIPKTLGRWHFVAGTESQLSPETAQTAGSSDHILRTYVDETTGESVSLFVLYGLAESVSLHTPLLCYPAAGFQLVPDSLQERELKMPELAAPVHFTSAYYVKRVAGLSEYSQILWTFRNDGVWKPAMADRWKLFRYHPGMFKIQLHRTSLAINSEHLASETLLKDIVHEIESRLAKLQGVTANTSVASQVPAN
jgi:hypothetical protein